MIKHQKEKYNWVFIFLAANQDAIKVASGFGIYSGNALTYGANAIGVHNLINSYSGTITNIRGFTGSSEELTSANLFTDKDRTNAMGPENVKTA